MKKNNNKNHYSDILIEKNYWNSWKYFLLFYKKTPIRTLVICIFSVIAAAVTIAIPFLTQSINKATSNNSLNLFFVFSFSIVSIYIIKIILDYLNQFLGTHFNYKLEVEWRSILMKKTLNLEMQNYDNRTIGDFISRVVNDLKDVLNFAFQFLTNIIFVTILLIGGFVYIFLVSWLVGLIPLLIILIAIFLYVIFLRKFVILRHISKGLNSRIVWKMEEYVRIISDIKINHLNDAIVEEFDSIQKRYLNASKKSNMQLTLYNVLGIATNVFTSSIVLIIASYGHLKGFISEYQLFGLTSATSLLVLPLTNLASIFTDIVKVTPALSRLYWWINQEIECENNHFKPVKMQKVEFRNVSFSYKLINDKKEIQVLKNFNMVWNKNECINLNGLSGSGKSTIFKLLLRFYDVDEGEILIDDVPIKDIDLRYLRSSISLATSEYPFYINKTIDDVLKNVDSFQRILEQLDIVELFEKENSSNQNLNSQGETLSQGEKQILNFAKAIYPKNKIILLDNIENLLDKNQLEKVNLILSMLKQDRIIVITNSNEKNKCLDYTRQINL